MSEEKVPAQASIEEQLANAKQEIQWLRDEAQVRKKDLRERIFCKIFDGGYERVGHELAIERTAKVVAFILGEDSHAPDEIAEIHAYLDSCGTLRGGSLDSPFSLEGRIKAYGVQHWNQGHAVGVANMMEIRDAETSPPIQVTPDRPMIPLDDLTVWIQDNIPPMLQVGLNANSGRERKILLELAKHFGIPESNLEPPA